jgi:hypothetical protein
MTYHRELAAGRWRQLALLEQMANVGSEVERALNWRAKNNPEYAARAFERSLELLDLSLECAGSRAHRKELARVREALVDYFTGSNEYRSTPEAWKKYFLGFAYAARINR